jgi:hypothetical protein
MKVYIVSDTRAGEYFSFPSGVFSTREKAEEYKSRVESYEKFGVFCEADIEEWELDKADVDELERRKSDRAKASQ